MKIGFKESALSSFHYYNCIRGDFLARQYLSFMLVGILCFALFILSDSSISFISRNTATTVSQIVIGLLGFYWLNIHIRILSSGKYRKTVTNENYDESLYPKIRPMVLTNVVIYIVFALFPVIHFLFR